MTRLVITWFYGFQLFSAIESSLGPVHVAAHIFIYINLAYRGKLLANSSAPEFSLENAHMQEISDSVFTEAA